MTAPAIVKELVERFAYNIDDYKRGKYNETQVRVEYIDPLFNALGWDVYNTQGYAEAYKEVVHEDAIKVGKATKAPDYSFRIGGARKFFLEAKKPSVDIKHDTHPAYQLRRYAWSAKLPLSILTDFEEFAVYDCRIKPDKGDKAAAARVMYLTYDQYLDKWQEIVDIFSPESIKKGSFDKYVESNKAKRGTAEVDDAFLQEIERWRDTLARNFALRNTLTQRQLNYAVQLTIDRIIFLRIAEDRGIEPYGQLKDLTKADNIYQNIFRLFEQADDRYNSGLFHFKAEKGREDPDTLTPHLKLDDKILKDIFKNLYYPDSPYEFSVLSADILGQVYEQFLGKVIRLTGKGRAIVEDKPEVKKAGGVYYTPTYIVDYIVKQTVGKLVEGQKPADIGGKKPLRVLDPACGSGSFLLGAYQFLLDWYLDWYIANNPEKLANKRNAPIYPAPTTDPNTPNWKLTIDQRKRILLAHIYGVDIDPQAVEVTKLSLLLKVLEGEDDQTLARQLTFAGFGQRVLPDLNQNIKCGNSLIGPDFYASNPTQMSMFDEDELYRINAFDWQAEFREIMQAGGFDAVIGNPPYVVIGKEIFSSEQQSYLNKYEVAQYKTDLFHLFLQKGLELTKPEGLFGYIVPNPWLTLQFAENLRRYLLSESEVQELVVFNHLVFQNANVYTAIIILSRCHPKPNHFILVRNVDKTNNANDITTIKPEQVLQSTWQENEKGEFETRLIGETGKFINRLIASNEPLGNAARASLGCQAYNSSKHTKQQIKERVFHSPTKLGEEYLPELAGSDVSRYLIDRKRGEWIKYGPWLHDYRTIDWLQGPRILLREIPSIPPYRIQACYVEETYCNYKTILNVNPDNKTDFSMKYLCGLLNSRLLSFLYPYMSNKMVAKSFPRLSVGDLRKLPIRTINFDDPTDKARHDKMVALVEQMLTLHKQLGEAKIPTQKTMLKRQIEATDRQIDYLVYELYGLTDEEIKIVEGQA